MDIKYQSRRETIKKRSIFSAIAVAVGLFFIFVSSKDFLMYVRNNKDITKMINGYNYIKNTARYVHSKLKTKGKFVILDEAPVSTFKGKNVFVLVIGETGRAQNFTLYSPPKGGKKTTDNTTPLLAHQNVVFFNDVSSCGTSTAISVPCMFSVKTREEFDVNKERRRENLLDLVQKAGYDVVWLDNNGCKGVCGRVPTIDLLKLKNKDYCDEFYCLDELLVEILEEKLSKIEKNTLFILHTIGSHGPAYYKRYPKKFRKFTPTCDSNEVQKCNQKSIENTYNNTILYTDYILSSIIFVLNKKKDLASGMLYVSDHGESLGENKIYLHGMPYAIAPKEQTHVPMLVWLSQKTQKEHYGEECLREKRNNAYSHDNIFHSMMGVLGVQSTTYKKELDIFNGCKSKK
jgi:lipid A ethanolaminephosphotransferase